MLKPSRCMRAVQWSSTLNLPRSSLPPRALEAARPTYLKQCTDDLYVWQVTSRSRSEEFILHDGPPYANGSLHIGHALNKILKDIICRVQIAQGKRVRYRPGWDCHGLPIEIKALQQKDPHITMSAVDIRKAARELATQTIEEQKRGFMEWAVLGDWANAYRTMDKDFEFAQLKVFKTMVEKGLIYRQFKPVHWSPSSRTALAEAELEYNEAHVSRAAFVKYKVPTDVGMLDIPFGLSNLQPIYVLIWTTTPWTLPANRAIAYHKDIIYSVFVPKSSLQVLVVAKSRLEDVLAYTAMSTEDIDIVFEASGERLFGRWEYVNPFQNDPLSNLQPFLHADFVSPDSGTGLVHMAPGHGFDDYNVCQEHGIPAFAPLDDAACFTDEAFPAQPELLSGKDIIPDGTNAVLDILSGKSGPSKEELIWTTHDMTHKYPIDWRTKLPVIVRATAQWFARVDSIKDHALDASANVEFIPENGRSRLRSFISGRSQWCISRQRAWGVPIPAIFNSRGESIMTTESVAHILNLIEKRGTDAWWTDPKDDPAWILPDLPPGTYTRGRDTMDVWFDSGTTWTQVLPIPQYLPEDHSVKPKQYDLALEGTDQHRGWFQSSLLTYVAQQANDHQKPSPVAPFKTLITHGFTLDAKGRKMSKSIGNVISPDEIMRGALLPRLKKRKGQTGPGELDAMGPDALRLWVAMSDYKSDVVISETVLKGVNGALAKYRVTFKFLLGALTDWTPTVDDHPDNLANRIAVAQLSRAQEQVQTAYIAHDFVKVISTINAYVNSELSSFYFETAKDPLYTGTSASRCSAQAVCFQILQGLIIMLRPVLPLLITEVSDHASDGVKAALVKSLHRNLPDLDSAVSPSIALLAGASSRSLSRSTPFDLAAAEAILTPLLTTLRSIQETARNGKKLRTGLECSVVLRCANDGIPIQFASLFPLDLESQRQNIETELASALVVSEFCFARIGAEVHEYEWSFQEDLPKSSPVQGMLVVTNPSGGKCHRCWRYVLDSQAEPEHVCGRCLSALEEMEHAASG